VAENGLDHPGVHRGLPVRRRGCDGGHCKVRPGAIFRSRCSRRIRVRNAFRRPASVKGRTSAASANFNRRDARSNMLLESRGGDPAIGRSGIP
jgi:hypothetical protein